MNSWHVVDLAQVPPTPWRNGGGTTQVLLAWPHAEPWRVRISVADVASDGPFSRYPGAERWFAVLDGAGVRLTMGGGSQCLGPASEPFRFSGSAEVDCALVDGPTRDLNLMALPGAGRMLRVGDAHVGVAPARTLVAAYAPAGGAVAVFDEEVLDLAPHTLAWRVLAQEGPVRLHGPGAYWMEVRL